MPEENAADDPPPGAAPAAGDSVVFGHFHVPRRADTGKLWELGRGAMGVTYRAFDTGLRVEVALKVIAADKVADPNTRARFQREARAAAKIRHPHVASVLHLGEQGGEFFYAMEFIAGRSLEALLRETAGPLAPTVAVALAAQVAAALNAAHRKEVLHRDLKPANLMLLEGDALDHEDERTRAAGGRQLKVIDFGLARRFGAGRQEDSFVTQSIVGFIGTPAYASPEQAGGDGELDGRSDLYALGVILWEMLAGRLPFTGNPMLMLSRHLTQTPPFEQLAGLPPVLVDLLTGLMEKEPAARRPQSAAELRDRLDGVLRALSEGGTPSVGSAAVVENGAAPANGGPHGGGPSRTPATTTVIEPGTTLLERYRLGREVGHGDGGRLFLAADNADGDHPVALKLLAPERVAAEPGFLEAVQAALFGARQHAHPVVLTPDAALLQVSAHTAFFVREWAEGFSLLELLRGRGALRAAEVFRLLDALPEALDHAAAHADAFPWLELSLPKLFVAPPAPGGSLPHPDWPGLRSKPVEAWPDFALRLNPLGFPPAVGQPSDVTRVSGLGRIETPAVALARLVRELLGASAEGTGPVSALKAEGNAVLARGLAPGAFADAAAFWAALRAAAMETPGSARAPRAGSDAPPGGTASVPSASAPTADDPTAESARPPQAKRVPPGPSGGAPSGGRALPGSVGPTPVPVVRPDEPPPRRGLPLGAWVAALVILVGGGLLAMMLWPPGKSDGKRSVALADLTPTPTPTPAPTPTPTPRPTPYVAPTPDAFQLALSEGQRAFGREEYEPALAAYQRAGAIRPGSSEVAEGLRQLDAVAARLFDEGNRLYDASDPAGAVAKWRVSAALGNARGQTGLGFMYANGRGGLAKDDAEAVRWYRKAAEGGNAYGQSNLGFMYENGRGGLTKDDAEAVRWYRKAAEGGDALGQTNLGVMYENGRGGLAKDDAEAVRWYRKVAEGGNARGQTNLGFMYENGRGGLAKDDAEAVRWYRKAAEGGDARGQTNLGFMYANGRGGLAKDDAEAVRWFRKAAEGGDAPAQEYLKGRGLTW